MGARHRTAIQCGEGKRKGYSERYKSRDGAIMRELRVINASIYAEIGGRKIDVEIRSSKAHAQGIALFIDGKKIIDLDYKDRRFIDGGHYDSKKAIFQLGKGASI